MAYKKQARSENEPNQMTTHRTVILMFLCGIVAFIVLIAQLLIRNVVARHTPGGVTVRYEDDDCLSVGIDLHAVGHVQGQLPVGAAALRQPFHRFVVNVGIVGEFLNDLGGIGERDQRHAVQLFAFAVDACWPEQLIRKVLERVFTGLQTAS